MKKIILGIFIGVCGTAIFSFTSSPYSAVNNREVSIEIVKEDIINDLTIIRVTPNGKAPVLVIRDTRNGGICTL